MKKLFLFTISLFIITATFAQNRGFKPISVPDATSGNLYEYSYALVIGESEYTSGWPRLNGVKSDVPEIKSALEAQGFYVVVKENIKSDDFDKTVKAFIATYGQKVNSRVLIYYAGHGHTIKNQLTNESMGYVVPVDAPNPAYDKAGFLTKAVDMNQFNNYALQLQAKHVLFMFDACFAGTIFSGRAGVPPAIDYKTAQPARQFITSGDESEVVADASIFRREFVNALTSPIADADKDGFLTASELSLYLYTQVADNSNGTQHPISGKLKNAAYNKGDFVFVLGNSQNKVTPPNPDVDNGQQVNATGNLKLISDYNGTLKITSITGTQLQTKSVSASGTYDFYSLSAGIVIINIYSGNKIVWTSKVNIPANGTTTIKAEKTTGSVQLISQISGSLYIDGTYKKSITANNSYTISDLTAGNHTLKIGNDWQETVYIQAGQTTTIRAEKPTGTLQLSTSVSGNFYIDDIMREYVSSGNRTYAGIDPGSHTAKIVSSGQTIWQSSFTIFAGRTTTLTAEAQNQNNNNNLTGNSGTFIDNRDNQTYDWVKIGNQTWMAENLAYKPNSGNYWAYDNNSSNISKYGYLYDYQTAQNVCPNGWHLPSDDEWKELEIYLGMSSTDANEIGWRGDIGNKLKSRSGWNSNGNSTNSSGFNAVASGYRGTDGSFDDAGDYGYWWSSSPNGSSSAWSRVLIYNDVEVVRYNYLQAVGFSVRCLRD